MTTRRFGAIAATLAAGRVPVLAQTVRQAHSSDHADTPEIAAAPGTDLTDDVMDTSLGVIFGNTVPALGLAAADGKEIPKPWRTEVAAPCTEPSPTA